MGDFKYKAVDSRGKRTTGTAQGSSKDVVRMQLARMRLKVISLEEVATGSAAEGLSLFGGRFRIDKRGNVNLTLGKIGAVLDSHLIIFTKQLQTMISSGVPLNQSLEILSRQQLNLAFGETIANIQKNIEEGGKFSDSLARHPVAFDSLYIAMVRAGEESGKISEVLLKLVTYIEKAARIKRQVKSAMTYPALIMCVAIAVIVGLMVFVVPKFAAQFSSAGRQLPALTQIVMNISEAFQNYWYYMLLAAFAAGQGFALFAKTKSGQYFVHAYALKAPIIGDLVRKVAVGRFCSTMASMLSSGVNIIQALSICSASAGNVVFEKFILYARTQVEQGQLLSTPIKANKLFPLMVVSMMEVGEKSGRMDEMLIKVSDFYDEEVDEAVKAMLAMIEPILIVFIGVIVGVLVIAMYLPILDMGNNVE